MIEAQELTKRYADKTAVDGIRELRRVNEILKAAASFFAAELDRPQRSL